MSNYQVSLGQKVLFSEDGGGTVVGGAGIEPDICHGLYLKNIDGVNKLIWKDSGDTVVESQVLSTWKGTKLVRKEGTYPASPDDGELLEDNTNMLICHLRIRM